jgi:sulfur carrier protein ThiS
VQLHLELYASLMEYLPPDAVRHRATVEVAAGASAHALLDRLGVPREKAHLVLRNGVFLDPVQRDEVELEPGDVIAAWPPVAGG